MMALQKRTTIKKIWKNNITAGLPPSKKFCFIYYNERPLKMMKNAFYFILKALFFLKIFKVFVLTFWSCRKNGLIRKKRLISKFMASQSGQQIHILPIISKSKGNQTMKFGQLIEYYKINIFLKIMHKMR